MTTAACLSYVLFLAPLCSTLGSTLGSGPASKSVDLDGDGALDLVLVDTSGALRLLRNAGEGRFEELADRGGLPVSVGGLHWHDVDGDGDLDVLALGAPGDGAAPRLFENAGPLVFAELERAFGLVALDPRGRPEWLDFDGDARIDLVWSAPDTVQFLRQVRRGVFEATSVLSVGPGANANLAPPPNGGAVVGASASTGPLASSSAPTMICAGTLVDSSTGGCIEASSTPVIGELYPLSANFNLDGAGRVGMGTTSPIERLDVAGRIRAQLGVRFGDGSLQSTAGTRDWNQLINVPAGFADGLDNDTLYGAGTGLSLSGTTFSVTSGGVSTSQLADAAVSSAKLANGSVSSAKLASAAVGATQLANDAASLSKVTGGGASMGAGSLMVNTVTPAGRVRIRHSSSTASPQLMLTQDGASDFARIGMDNPLSAQTWTIAGGLTASAATDQFNVFHSSAGNVLSIGGNNRVGVNTASPLTALHVNGSLHLQGTTQDISAPATDSLELGHRNGSSFTPRLTIDSSGAATFSGALSAATATRWVTVTAREFTTSLSMVISSSGDYLQKPNSSVCTADANLRLPHGAVLTAFRARVTDSSPDVDVTVRMARYPFGDGVGLPMASVSSSGVASGEQTLTDTSIDWSVVNNQLYHYQLEVFISSGAITTGQARFHRVQIEYTTPSSVR
jgi:hypothetical protein